MIVLGQTSLVPVGLRRWVKVLPLCWLHSGRVFAGCVVPGLGLLVLGSGGYLFRCVVMWRSKQRHQSICRCQITGVNWVIF